MRKYSDFKAVFLSFYSRDLYRDVLNNWQGYGFAYLAKLILLVLVLAAFVLFSLIYKVTNGDFAEQLFKEIVSRENITLEAAIDIYSQIPDIEILPDQGKILTAPEKPHLIKNKNTDRVYAIIDNSKQYKSVEDIKNTNALLLVTQDSIVFNQISGVFYSIYLSKLKTSTLENLKEFVEFVNQLPNLSFNNGVMTTGDDQIHFIKYRDLRVIFDTSDRIKEFVYDDADYFITSNKVVKLNKENQLQEYSFEELLIGMWKYYFVNIRAIIIKAFLLVAPIIYVVSYVLLFSAVMVVSLVVRIIASIKNVGNISTYQYIRLTAVAMTPSIILINVIPFFTTTNMVMFFVVAFVYLLWLISNLDKIQKDESGKNTT